MNAGRLARLTPSALDAEQAEVYEEIVGGPRAKATRLTDDDGALAGPFNAMLVAPAIGLHLQRLGSAIRYETSLPDAAREIAILLVARAEQSEFEWYAHVPIAIAAGVPESVVAAIFDGDELVVDDLVEGAVAAVTASVMDSGDVTDDIYDAASRVLTDVQLVELMALIGYYRLLSGLLRVFRVTLPSDATPRFGGEGDRAAPTV